MKIEEGRLRPLEEKDLEMVLAWRNSERVRSFMYTDHLISIEEHRRWFSGLNPQQQVCLVFELNGRACGFVNIYQIDRRHERCTWGFYIGVEGVPRGTGLLMGYLAMEYMFQGLPVGKICSEALITNKASVAYHHKLGFTDEGILRAHIKKAGHLEDVLMLALFRDSWASRREQVQGLIEAY